MDKKTLEKIKKWQDFKDLEQDLKVELKEMEKDENLLMDAFYEDIAFGTGGLRGIIGC